MKRKFILSDSLLSAMDSGKALHVAAAHPAHMGVMLNAGEGGNGDKGSGSGDNGGDAGKGNDNKGDGKSDAGKGDDKLSYDELELQYLRTQKALRKANKEAEARRLELEEAKSGKKKSDDKGDGKGDDKGKDDGETEKLKKQLSDATEKSRKRIIKAAVMIEAAKVGFHDPADAFALADLSDIEFDDEKDEVAGVEDALKELSKRKPHLIKTAENSNGQPSPKKPDTNAGAKGKGKDGELAIDEDAIRRKYSIR